MKLTVDYNKPDKQKAIAAGLAVMLLLAAYGMFIVKPVLNRIASLTARENVLKEQLQKAERAAKDKESLYQEVKDIEWKIAFLESRLPPDVDVAQVLEQLIRLGKEAGVIFVALEPQEVKRIAVVEGMSGYMEIPVKLSLRAGFHSFGQFVTAIENSRRFMRVDKIRMQSVAQDMTRHDINLVVNAYALEGSHYASP